MVKKIFFDEGVDEKKRKQVKLKLLTENKGILLLDMTQEFNLKSGTTDTIGCDILTITNSPFEFNALKKYRITQMRGTLSVNHMIYIPGGERIIIKRSIQKSKQ